MTWCARAGPLWANCGVSHIMKTRAAVHEKMCDVWGVSVYTEHTGPTIPFGAMVEYHPYFCQRPVRDCISFGKKVPYRVYSSAMYNTPGRIWGKDGTLLKTYAKRTPCKESVNAPKMVNILIPGLRWNSQTLWRRSGFWEHPTLIRDHSNRREEQR